MNILNSRREFGGKVLLVAWSKDSASEKRHGEQKTVAAKSEMSWLNGRSPRRTLNATCWISSKVGKITRPKIGRRCGRRRFMKIV